MTQTPSRYICIKGLDKAEVLVALYNHSQQQGMGFWDSRGYNRLAIENARKIIDALRANNAPLVFDYLYGRVLKVDITNNTLDALLYDRDNGPGAAEWALLTELT